MFDIIIGGCGFSGAVLANILAERYQKRVLILEQRGQIGGNMSDYRDQSGIIVHRYGPHIFHTNDREVFEYLSRFTEWFPYEHRVVGKIDGRLVPIPFNLTALETLFERDKAELIKAALRREYDRAKVPVLELLGAEDPLIREFGQFVFEKVFVHYTAKQWGIPAEKVDISVLNRVPVCLTYDDRYFSDAIQAMPQNGFTPLFERLLANERITVELRQDALKRISLRDRQIYFDGEPFSGIYIHTGPTDALFGYCFGHLPYRSLRLEFETLETAEFQPCAVVNYPNEEQFTRITEFCHFTSESRSNRETVVLREYPQAYEEGRFPPYYPMNNPQTEHQFEQYQELAGEYPGLVLCGRLAEYRYYNMDQCVKRAMELADILGRPDKK